MRITKISPCRTDKSRVMVYFEDKSYCKVDMLKAKALGLKPGEEVDSKVLPELAEETRRCRAREAAARALSRRNMSSMELMRKLKDKGIAEEDATYALNWAERVGVINDSEYAKILLSHYRQKGFGNIRIREEMRKRGIDRSIIDLLLEDDTDMNDEIFQFIEKKLRTVKPDETAIRKITAALVRRGHTFSDIRAGFRRFEIEMEETD